MSNFSQFVGLFIAGQDLVLKLTTSWDKQVAPEGSTLVIVTQPAVRRTLGIAHTPKRITIKAQDSRLEELLQLNSKTSEAHVAKFEEQAAVHKQDLANRKLIAKIGASLEELGITF